MVGAFWLLNGEFMGEVKRATNIGFEKIEVSTIGVINDLYREVLLLAKLLDYTIDGMVLRSSNQDAGVRILRSIFTIDQRDKWLLQMRIDSKGRMLSLGVMDLRSGEKYSSNGEKVYQPLIKLINLL